jgi:hypothetical protein
MNQSIEDASRSEFETKFSHMDLDKVKDAWGKEKYKHEHIESIWYGWQAARQSNQSNVPVAKPAEFSEEDVIALIGSQFESYDEREHRFVLTAHDLASALDMACLYREPPNTSLLELSHGDTRQIFREWQHAEEIPHGLYVRFKRAERALIQQLTQPESDGK